MNRTMRTILMGLLLIAVTGVEPIDAADGSTAGRGDLTQFLSTPVIVRMPSLSRAGGWLWGVDFLRVRPGPEFRLSVVGGAPQSFTLHRPDRDVRPRSHSRLIPAELGQRPPILRRPARPPR